MRYSPEKTAPETNIRAIIGRWAQVPGFTQSLPCSLLRAAEVFWVEVDCPRSFGAIL